MATGGKRVGAGRKPGIANKLHKNAALSFKLIGVTPAEFLDEQMNHAKDLNVRMEAAKALLSYVHKKQPEAKEVNVTGLPDTIHFTFE